MSYGSRTDLHLRLNAWEREKLTNYYGFRWFAATAIRRIKAMLGGDKQT